MGLEVYEWVLSGILGNQFVQTVQHVQADVTTPVNPYASALLIAQDMVGGTGPVTSLMSILPMEYIPTSLRVKKVSGAGGATAIVLQGDMTEQIGQRAGELSVSSIGPCIIWIPTTAPDKTGRMFVPGVTEDDIHNNTFDPALITALNAWISDYVQLHTLSGHNYEPVVWRRARPLEIPPVAASADIIFAGQTSPVVGTQRKRLHPV